MMTCETWSRTLFEVLFPISCKHGRRNAGQLIVYSRQDVFGGVESPVGWPMSDRARALPRVPGDAPAERGGHVAVLEESHNYVDISFSVVNRISFP